MKYVIHRDTLMKNIHFNIGVTLKYRKNNNALATIDYYLVTTQRSKNTNDTVCSCYYDLPDYLVLETDFNSNPIKHDRMLGDTILVVAEPSLLIRYFSRSGEPIPEKEIQYKFFYDSVIVLSKDTTNIHFYFKR